MIPIRALTTQCTRRWRYAPPLVISKVRPHSDQTNMTNEEKVLAALETLVSQQRELLELERESVEMHRQTTARYMADAERAEAATFSSKGREKARDIVFFAMGACLLYFLFRFAFGK